MKPSFAEYIGMLAAGFEECHGPLAGRADAIMPAMRVDVAPSLFQSSQWEVRARAAVPDEVLVTLAESHFALDKAPPLTESWRHA